MAAHMVKTFGKWIFSALLLFFIFILSLQFYISSNRPAAWFPFSGDIFGRMYVASPFGFASNVREDNPVWQNIPAINKTLSRMTYAMTRGKPEADVAWLMLEAEFPDKADLSAGTQPNQHESATSKAINEAGLVYDRISRNDLLQATAQDNTVRIGDMHFRALLVDHATVMAPELLQRIQEITAAGIPVFWMGELPQRAPGWTDHEQRDQQVKTLVASLRDKLLRVDHADQLRQPLAKQVASTVVLAEANLHGLKLQRRHAGDTQWALLFNDSKQPLAVNTQPDLLKQPVHWLNPEDGKTDTITANDLPLQIPAGRTRILQVGNDTADWQEEQWRDPGMAYRPYIRWWWPGNAVNPAELVREITALHAAGFGGVEIQTLTFGLQKSQLQTQADTIYQVGTDAWFANVRKVFETADTLGMKVDLTFGSGWPTGAPFITEHPERQLLMASATLKAGETLHDLPAASEPLYAKVGNRLVEGTQGTFDTDTQLAAVTAARKNAQGQLVEFVDLSAHVDGQHVRWAVPAGDWLLFAFYQNATHHNVLASAYPGAEIQNASHQVNVVDHLDRAGIDEYIDKLGKPWLSKLAPYQPHAFFVDSFELIGQLPWSKPFRETFLHQHGYDISPYLPLVFRRHGESKYLNMLLAPGDAYSSENDSGRRIREDYEATRETLFREQHVLPLKAWLAQKNIAFRLQAHGGFGDYLDNYQLADIPESEGLFANGTFEFLKLAASAAHVAGKPIISSESFVAMAMDPQQFEPDDFYYLAGNAYAAGINRLMFHGYAYALAKQP
jgi:hypothetical protein